MKLSQKWIDLGWEKDDGYTFEAFSKKFPDKTLHLVSKTPSGKWWMANVYKNNTPFATATSSHKTLSKALKSFYP